MNSDTQLPMATPISTRVAMLFFEDHKNTAQIAAIREIFDTSPLARVWVFSKRLQFKRPGWEDTGAGGMLPFAWFVWEHGYIGKPTLGWI